MCTESSPHSKNLYRHKHRHGSNHLLEEDWKIKTAVRTPTNAVTAKATVGKGDDSPKFSKSPLPVPISTLIAAANPIIARRPSHTSKLFPSLVFCSHLMDTAAAFLADFLIEENLFTARGEPVAKVAPLAARPGSRTRGTTTLVPGEPTAQKSRTETEREAET